MKLFRYANSLIPPSSRPSSTVSILATAGMRLLPADAVSDLYSGLKAGLSADPDFHYTILSISTLSGSLEGYYGLLSSNYLLGKVSSSLATVPGEGRPVGSLDMGGSSTQVTFDPTGSRDLRRENLFIKSYLGYGGDTMRERAWSSLAGAVEAKGADRGKVDNPCAFVGHSVEWNGATLVGTGSAEGCRSLLLSVMDPGGRGVAAGRIDIDGEEHPEMTGEFYAMSLYFFASDCLRHLSPPDHPYVRSWPNPSMEEMLKAAEGFCARPWNDFER